MRTCAAPSVYKAMGGGELKMPGVVLNRLDVDKAERYYGYGRYFSYGGKYKYYKKYRY